MLADLGAEVVRVENPDGEHSRQVGLTFAANNRNKLSLGIDLTRPEGLDVLARITEQSDVVLTNALPEASARLGIDYATVAARNPASCHISILGFFRRPRSAEEGWWTRPRRPWAAWPRCTSGRRPATLQASSV